MVLEPSSQMNLAQSAQDLESSSRGRSRWPTQGTRKGLLAAAGVGVVLVVLVISAAIIVNRESSSPSGEQDAGKRLGSNNAVREDDGTIISLPDVLGGVYSFKQFNGSWVLDDCIQYFSANGDLMLYNVTLEKAETLISAELFYSNLRTRPAEVTLSPDKQFALVSYDQRRIYRHSVIAKYAIFEFASSRFWRLVPEPEHQSPIQPDLLQLVAWSPENNGIAYVYNNNVYYRPSPSEGVKSVNLTSTGDSVIYHGIADWVYEEEMFSTFRAIWFSPKGGHLAYASFNDTKVMDIEFLIYGEPGQFPRFQYPMVEKIPYPKAGTANPVASITMVNLNSGKYEQQEADINEAYYIGTATWATDDELVIVTMNRPQNHTEYLSCKNDGSCDKFYTIDVEDGWFDINTPKVSADGNEVLIWKSSKSQLDDATYRHIARINRSNGQEKLITNGSFSIDSISAWDEKSRKVYFMATYYDLESKADPSQTHLYSVGTDDQKINCITCSLNNMDANSKCMHNSADLSSDLKSFVHTCGGPGVPEVHVRSLESPSQAQITWVNNNELRQKLQGVKLPEVKDYDVPLASGFTAKARLWLPPNYQKGKKYPLLVDVYGGPGSQKITQAFSVSWGTSLTSAHNIIYASIDGRGSGRQSDELMYQIYRRLGTVEIEDQIAVAKWLIANDEYNIIDGNRTAIWGWSYGGYATAMVMGTDIENVYKCGISVAPVTSWVFYDTIYTERYMGLPTPDDNLYGYNASDVTNHIENFRTKKYYLIHGNADDNVHYQQSMILSRALEKADILFRQQSYPDENHGIGSVRRHLYHSLENFLLEECFKND